MEVPVYVIGGWQQSAAIAVKTGREEIKSDSGMFTLGPLGKPVLVGIGVKVAYSGSGVNLSTQAHKHTSAIRAQMIQMSL